MKPVFFLLIVLSVGLLFGCTGTGQSSNDATTLTPDLNSTTSTAPTFSLAVIATHNTAQDCWTAINGHVYNITPFIGSHPGGPIIATACGIDASILFNLRPNTVGAPHPAQANSTLAKYYIGDLAQ